MRVRGCAATALVWVGVASAVGQDASRAARTTPVTEAEVDRVTRAAILIDTHNDVTSKTVTGYDLATPNRSGQTDLARMKGHLGAEFFAVFVDASYVKENHAARRTLEMIDTVRTDVWLKHPEEFLPATTAEEIERAHREHKIAALMGIEGGHAIEDSLRLLRDYYALGVRYMTLTHFNTNDWADSQGDTEDTTVAHHNGLTPFGKDVVREMNRLGMMVDISHVADKTFYDAIEVSTAPLIASHSGSRAVSSFTRNMTDDMLRALAKKGGTAQVNFGCGFLSQRFYDAEKPLEKEMKARFLETLKIADPVEREKATDALEADLASKIPPATLADVVATIDHMVAVAGVDHVGIGTDFDGVECVPKELDGYDKFPVLTRALLEHGYTQAEIVKIYGGNLLRVMRAVEQRAAELHGEAPVETVYAPTSAGAAAR